MAKKAILEMKQAKWPNALKTAKKAKDKSIYNFYPVETPTDKRKQGFIL